MCQLYKSKMELNINFGDKIGETMLSGWDIVAVSIYFLLVLAACLSVSDIKTRCYFHIIDVFLEHFYISDFVYCSTALRDFNSIITKNLLNLLEFNSLLL